jgi:hypothetical protein
METSPKSLSPEAYQELPPGRTYVPFVPPILLYFLYASAKRAKK